MRRPCNSIDEDSPLLSQASMVGLAHDRVRSLDQFLDVKEDRCLRPESVLAEATLNCRLMRWPTDLAWTAVPAGRCRVSTAKDFAIDVACPTTFDSIGHITSKITSKPALPSYLVC